MSLIQSRDTCQNSGSAADEPQIREVPVPLVELEAVADEELVRNREADIAHRQIVDQPPVRAVEEGRDVKRAGPAQIWTAIRSMSQGTRNRYSSIALLGRRISRRESIDNFSGRFSNKHFDALSGLE